jgi:hypothetical protein
MTFKKRSPHPPADRDLVKEIEEFAAGADDVASQEHDKDPNCKRDYKAVRLPFNEYEYEQLVIGANLSGRSKLNFIRFAILKFSKELQSESK